MTQKLSSLIILLSKLGLHREASLVKLSWGSENEWRNAFKAILSGATKAIAPTKDAMKHHDLAGNSEAYNTVLNEFSEDDKKKILNSLGTEQPTPKQTSSSRPNNEDSYEKSDEDTDWDGEATNQNDDWYFHECDPPKRTHINGHRVRFSDDELINLPSDVANTWYQFRLTPDDLDILDRSGCNLTLFSFMNFKKAAYYYLNEITDHSPGFDGWMLARDEEQHYSTPENKEWDPDPEISFDDNYGDNQADSWDDEPKYSRDPVEAYKQRAVENAKDYGFDFQVVPDAEASDIRRSEYGHFMPQILRKLKHYGPDINLIFSDHVPHSKKKNLGGSYQMIWSKNPNLREEMLKERVDAFNKYIADMTETYQEALDAGEISKEKFDAKITKLKENPNHNEDTVRQLAGEAYREHISKRRAVPIKIEDYISVYLVGMLKAKIKRGEPEVIGNMNKLKYSKTPDDFDLSIRPGDLPEWASWPPMPGSLDAKRVMGQSVELGEDIFLTDDEKLVLKYILKYPKYGDAVAKSLRDFILDRIENYSYKIKQNIQYRDNPEKALGNGFKDWKVKIFTDQCNDLIAVENEYIKRLTNLDREISELR